MERFCNMKQKEVINVLDGRRMGCIYDIMFDCCKGCLVAIVVPGCGKLTSLFKGGEDIVIPWSNIVKFGDDVILVECDVDILGC